MAFGTIEAFLLKIQNSLQTSDLSVLQNIRTTCMCERHKTKKYLNYMQ